MSNQRPPKGFVTIILVVVLVLVLSLMSVYTIDAGERGVILTFGKPNQLAMAEGGEYFFEEIKKVFNEAKINTDNTR